MLMLLLAWVMFPLFLVALGAAGLWALAIIVSGVRAMFESDD